MTVLNNVIVHQAGHLPSDVPGCTVRSLSLSSANQYTVHISLLPLHVYKTLTNPSSSFYHCPSRLCSTHTVPLYTVQYTHSASLHCAVHTQCLSTLYSTYTVPLYTVQYTHSASLHCTLHTQCLSTLYSTHTVPLYTVQYTHAPRANMLP